MKKTPPALKASRKYNLRNKELINKKSLEHAKKNPEKVMLTKKKYREENKKKLRQSGKEYYEKNKEKIAAKSKARYSDLKIEREVIKKMFGKNKTTKKGEEKPVGALAIQETPDLVVPNPSPQSIGMPGFTADSEPVQSPDTQVTQAVAPNPLQVAPQAPVPAPVAPVAPAPAPAPVVPAPAVKEQYQVVAAELLPEGLYRYVIVTNKNLGEVGGVYDA